MGMASTATGTIVAQIIPATRKGEGIGYYSMSATLATAIGPFIGLYMRQHTSFQMIFSFCLALGVISLITAFFLVCTCIERHRQNHLKLRDSSFPTLLSQRQLPIAFITLVLAFCYSSVLSFINFYAIEINLVDTASFFFLVYAVAVLGITPIHRPLMDLKGANFIMYPAFIIFGAGMLLLSSDK